MCELKVNYPSELKRKTSTFLPAVPIVYYICYIFLCGWKTLTYYVSLEKFNLHAMEVNMHAIDNLVHVHADLKIIIQEPIINWKYEI